MGYLRINSTLVHRQVWEEHNGPVPEGLQLHHINGNRLDNRIENLMLVDPTTHKRLHGGCKLIDGEWWKPCRQCGEMKKVETDYYKYKAANNAVFSICKKCHYKNGRKRLEARKSVSS
jgi:hypothetical protein